MVKKKKVRFPKELEPAFGLAGISIGSLLVGSKLQPLLPVGVQNPVTAIGVQGSKLVSPLLILGGVSIIAKQLKDIEKLEGGKR